jgi:uncharacterized alpha-E superfamily protein
MLSRVADSLYWLSRNLERAEHAARMIDVHLNLVLDESSSTPLRQRRERLLYSLWMQPTPQLLDDDYALTQYVTFEPTNDASITETIALARENARQIREQISSEMWTQINKVYLDIKCASMEEVWGHQPHEFFRSVREGSHLFQGITDATMNRSEGWQFIQLGRYIERAQSVARVLDVNVGAILEADGGGDHYVQKIGLLKSVTSFEAYSKVYHGDLESRWIIEFLLFNPSFPHAVRFCVEHMNLALREIGDETGVSKQSRLYRCAGRLNSMLSYDMVDDVLDGDLHGYLHDIQHLCHLIHEALFETYIAYTIESAS